MPVSLIWLQEPHRDLDGETRGNQFSHTGLAPAQLLGAGRGSVIKYGLQLLPSFLPICTSPVRSFGVKDCPDSGGDQSGLGEEAMMKKQRTYSGHFIRSRNWGAELEGI